VLHGTYRREDGHDATEDSGCGVNLVRSIVTLKPVLVSYPG